MREWAIAGEMVGVTDPPRSFDELQDQLNAFRPDLCGGERALRTVKFVRNAPVPLAAKAPYSVLFAGAAATMPKYQRELLGLPTISLTAVKPLI